MSEREVGKAAAVAFRDRVLAIASSLIPDEVRHWVRSSIDEQGPSAELSIEDPGKPRNNVVLQVWFGTAVVFPSVNVPNWILGKVRFPDVRSETDGGYTDFNLTGIEEDAIAKLFAACAAEYAK